MENKKKFPIEMLREAVQIEGSGIHCDHARNVLAAYDSVVFITDLLIARQKVTCLLDQLQSIRGDSPNIILRLVLDPKILKSLIKELEHEVKQELERLRIEKLIELRQKLLESFLMLQVWREALVNREEMRIEILKSYSLVDASLFLYSSHTQ